KFALNDSFPFQFAIQFGRFSLGGRQNPEWLPMQAYALQSSTVPRAAWAAWITSWNAWGAASPQLLRGLLVLSLKCIDCRGGTSTQKSRYSFFGLYFIHSSPWKCSSSSPIKDSSISLNFQPLTTYKPGLEGKLPFHSCDIQPSWEIGRAHV